jgi:hypothetical protein
LENANNKGKTRTGWANKEKAGGPTTYLPQGNVRRGFTKRLFVASIAHSGVLLSYDAFFVEDEGNSGYYLSCSLEIPDPE